LFNYNTLKLFPSDRIIRIEGVINEKIATKVSKELFDCDYKDVSPILLYINSPGGSVTSAFSINAVMNLLKSPVYTFASGQASSSASYVLMNGYRGCRFADSYSTVLIHYASPVNIIEGDISESLKSEILKVNKNIERFIQKSTKNKISVIRKDLENETFFTAREAQKYGILDCVI